MARTFLEPACLDWEHKRFFPGDLGELTGEMGTVVTYSRSKRFFDRTLAKMRALLKENGYCGYINLNTMVNESGIWPLEFTCRFGYPGYAILDPLQRTSWADLFRLMLERNALRFETEPGFSVGIVITTPPFPYCREQVTEPIGLPVLFDDDVSPADRRNLHYGEVGLSGGLLVTSGCKRLHACRYRDGGDCRGGAGGRECSGRENTGSQCSLSHRYWAAACPG